MRTHILGLAFALISLSTAIEAADPIAATTAKGFKLHSDRSGTPIRLMSKGSDDLTAADYKLIAKIKSLESIGLNATSLKDSEWGFLHELPKLKRLSIWHAKGISSLTPFSGLQVEGLTIGGSMGLRDNHRDDVQQHRDAVLTLKDLPNLKALSLYHTPLTPDDSHLVHIVKEFPKLEELRLDFAAPRNTDVNISPAGLSRLQSLPLKKLTIENIQPLGPKHMRAIAKIESLTTLAIDARKKPIDTALTEVVKAERPDLKIDVQIPNKK